MKHLKFLFMALCAVVTFSCTSDDTFPYKDKSDPEGTVYDEGTPGSGEVVVDNVYYIGTSTFNPRHIPGFSQFGETSIADVGVVDNLSSITSIYPNGGWHLDDCPVIEGHGYVVHVVLPDFNENYYVRVYVCKKTKDYVAIKYQTHFTPQ